MTYNRGSFLVVVVLCLCLTSCSPVAAQSGGNGRALLVVDVQNCFTGNGSVSVNGGDEIVPVINKIREEHAKQFDVVVLTQDWHCVDHVSFASQHLNRHPYDVVNLTYLLPTGQLCRNDGLQKNYTVACSPTTSGNKTTVVRQVLWPDHCIANTPSAELHSRLLVNATDIVIKKGNECHIDSYSAFEDIGNFRETELKKKLQSHSVESVFLVGVALDYCVLYTAKDARRLGLKTFVVLDATASVASDTEEAAKREMTRLGISLVSSSQLEEIFASKASRSVQSCIIRHFVWLSILSAWY